ncbi:MAG: hypothetical protein JWM41_4963 [Gemmatimonadetes bacterium]|nr:hypothetical protein [Gemmatimonadota bacterium]
MPEKTDFGAVFHGLRSILDEYAPQLKVVHDRPGYFYLDTYTLTYTLGPNKKPIA